MSHNDSNSRIGCWLTVCGKPTPCLASELSVQVEARIASGDFTRKDVDYVEHLERGLVKDQLVISNERLEKLRRLCQLWEVELRSSKISSHRPLIGPIIVAAKRMLLPVLKVLFKDTMRQQRDFNAAVISLLTDLARENKAKSGSSQI